MTFEKGNRYLLTDISGTRKNPLHEKIVGRICELRSMNEREFGWFDAEMDDGVHTICTSIIYEVGTDDDGTLTVSTANSTYTFALISQPLDADCTERMCESGAV
jgi:hypothetical protein